MNDIERIRQLSGIPTVAAKMNLTESMDEAALPAHDGSLHDLYVSNIIRRAKEESKHQGCVKHVNEINGKYYVEDWYDGENTVASFENGHPIGDTTESIDEDSDDIRHEVVPELTHKLQDNIPGVSVKISYVAPIHDGQYNAGFKWESEDDSGIGRVKFKCDHEGSIRVYGVTGLGDIYIDQDLFNEGIDHAPLDETDVDESAPPGMEALVRKLKKEYPGHEEKAFATAWAIYNKKHGKGKTVGEARGKKEAIKAPFHAEEINALVPLSYEEAYPRALEMVQNCTASPEKKAFLSRQIETNRKGVPGIVQVLYNMLLSFEGNAVIGSSYGSKFRRMKEELDETERGDFWEDIQSFLEDDTCIDGDQIRKAHGLYVAGKFPKEFYGDNYDYADDTGVSLGFDKDDAVSAVYDLLSTELEEDLNNGYDDRHEADEFGEYPGFGFPNGADGPVTKKSGPSGAKTGDNPEQKTMAVAEASEIYKELVYGYRSHLKESADRALEKKLNESPTGPLAVELEDYDNTCFSNSGDSANYTGQVTMYGKGLGIHNDFVQLSYVIHIDADSNIEWEDTEYPSGHNSETGHIDYTPNHTPSTGPVNINRVMFGAGDFIEVEGNEYSAEELGTVLRKETIAAILSKETYTNLLSRMFERYADDVEYSDD